MKMKRVAAITVLSLSLIIPAQSAMAAPGLTQQISINERANKIATVKCGKWSKNISNTRKTCRVKVLKANGYIPLYDLSDLPPVPRLDPHAAPAGDTYAAR